MGLGTIGKVVGKSFFWYLKFGFKLIFIIYLIIHAIVLGIETKDINTTILAIGTELMSPLYSINELSLNIIENGFQFDDLLNLLLYFYVILIWIKIFAWFGKKFIMMDDSRTTNAFLFGLVIFFLLQTLYLVITDKDINIIWQVWKNFFSAVRVIFGYDYTELIKFKEINNSCLNDICVI